MEMSPALEKYLLAFNGTIVSLVLFIVTYRQTVGARRERARVATQALERACLRRLIQDGRAPSLDEVALLRTGLSREHNVRESELPDLEVLYSVLYTRVSDSDFIDSERREKALAALASAVREPEPAEAPVSSTQSAGQRGFIAFLAVATSVLGVAIGAIPFVGSIGTLLAPELLATFGVSLSAIMATLVGRRLRERGDALAPNSDSPESFQDSVLTLIRKSKVAYDWNRGRSSYDFEVRAGARKYLIEAKYWRPWHSRAILHQLGAALGTAVRNEAPAQAIIVVPDGTPLPSTPLPADVRILAFSDFAKEVAAWKADARKRAG